MVLSSIRGNQLDNVLSRSQRIVGSIKLEMSSEQLVLTVAAFQLCFVNASFWQHLASVIGGLFAEPLTYLSIFLLMLALMSLLYGLITPSRVTKPVLYFFLFLAATTSYFMDNYGAVIDRHALQSAFESDARESMEWLSASMLWPILLLGVLPAVIIHRFVEIRQRSLKQGIVARALFVSACLLISALSIAYSYQTLSSVARNHPNLRDLINPFNAVNAVRGYVRNSLRVESTDLRSTGADAARGPSWANASKIALTPTNAELAQNLADKPLMPTRKPTLFVMVVGESTRAASFGLLGYTRDTTPELAKWPLLLFRDVSSCGTNTATSVPCLFSNLGRANYDEGVADSQENLLDILKRTGFAVEWIDNNTGSKDVAKRLPEINVAMDTDPALCNADGCHDEILIRELTNRLPSINTDTVLVLHMLGSHGPAYFHRYPERFARFSPICTSVELHKCTQAEVLNSYDNTVLYTDYVLAKILALLDQHKQLNTGLLFVSDHGESTGESGYFLHGAPYAIAPKEQNQVPMFFWFSNAYATQRGMQTACMQAQLQPSISHDAVFPLVLGVLDIATTVYRADADPFARCYFGITS
jgi:lipid A ethanolaminephosphotransferase